MKKLEYIAPSIEELDVIIEKGFASSGGTSSAPINGWDNGNF